MPLFVISGGFASKLVPEAKVVFFLCLRFNLQVSSALRKIDTADTATL